MVTNRWPLSKTSATCGCLSQRTASVDAVLQGCLKRLQTFTRTPATEGLKSSSVVVMHSALLVRKIFTTKPNSGIAFPLLKEEIVKTKYLQHLAVLSTLALVFPLGALARDNAHSVDISDVVQIGSTQLKPGNY